MKIQCINMSSKAILVSLGLTLAIVPAASALAILPVPVEIYQPEPATAAIVTHNELSADDATSNSKNDNLITGNAREATKSASRKILKSDSHPIAAIHLEERTVITLSN